MLMVNVSDSTCPSGKFGELCNKRCGLCQKTVCNRTTGACEMCRDNLTLPLCLKDDEGDSSVELFNDVVSFIFIHSFIHYLIHHLQLHLPLNREGRWSTTDDFTNSFLIFSLFFTSLWGLGNSRPVHSLMLSSHLFFCLPCLLPPFIVPSKVVLTRPDERETALYYFILRLFTMDSSSCGPIACWIPVSYTHLTLPTTASV